MKKLLLILLFCTSAQQVFSAFSLFNVENLNNRLSNNAILSMYQDHYGFMWFGTYDGLNLYNGKEVTTFRFESGNPHSLSGNSIHRIMPADEDHLWVITQIGLDKFSLKELNVVESYTDYKKVELITSNGKGEMWLINNNDYLTYYNGQKNKMYDIPWEGTGLQDIKSIFVDENDQLCFIQREGKLQFITLTENKNKKDKPYSLAITGKSFHDKQINSVFYEDGQICFIDEEYNLFIYDKAKDRKVFLRNLKKVINKYGVITSMCFFRNDIFIAFVYNGLIKLNMANSEELEQINTTIGIFSLLKDRNQQAMWVATDGRGVNLYYEEKDTFGNILLEDMPFMAQRPVRAIYTDEYNSLWIGTKGDGIIKIRDYESFNNKLIPARNVEILSKGREDYKKPIYHFLRSKYNKNDLWIGADNLYYYSYKNNEIYDVEISDPSGWKFPDDVHTLCEVNDSTLWVSSKGLYEVILDKKATPYKIKSSKKQVFLKEGNDMDDFFYSMIYDGDSILILGSRRGYGAIRFNIYEKSYRFISMENADNKGLGDAICLHIRDSILYIGASSGLTRVDRMGEKENQIKQFGRKDGIINDMIHGISEDNSGIIWLSTNKGLVKYNPKNDSFFNVKSSKIAVSEFSDNAYWYCPFTNRLFFGGINGLSWIEPKKEGEADLLFTGLILSGKRQSLVDYNKDDTRKIILQADHHTFQIEFAVLDYINGSNYDYSYLLENYDTGWVSLRKENKISFTKLLPGEYILKVKYKNDVVNENKVFTLPITVLPPWYLSNIAYTIYIFLFTALVLFLFFYVNRKFRKKQEMVAARIKREQKEKLYESKMKFFTNVTHELYTPLTLINGAVNRIVHASRPDQMRKYADILQSNVAGLNELIQEILDYSRIEEGHVDQLKLQRISVTDLLNDLLSSFITLVSKNNIELSVSGPENLYWYTDKSRMKKIVINLLSNAFKYTPEKGEIKIDVREENEYLKIVIYNTGKGIEEERLGSVFNRFQVLEETDVNANDQMTARNGLGLSICYSMTKLLKGDLKVRSEINRFTEFTVILPSLTDNEASKRESDKRETKEINGKTRAEDQLLKTTLLPVQDNNSSLYILVVDDNKEIVELISDILIPHYNVLKASGVAEAREILKKQTPALIITDIMMPETDGLSFIRMLREDKYNKHLPVIALSAKVDETDVIKGYATGADTYITKPFSPDILLSIVDRFLINKEEIKSYYETAESAFTYNSGKLMHIEDRKFIETLSEIVKENINNPELGPEFIAERMKISSRNLYRQLKKILSVSLRDFIKDYRLSYAARLLLTTNLTVKEIIHKIGFSNKSYFYNEFFRKYNTSPKQYQEANKEKKEL